MQVNACAKVVDVFSGGMFDGRLANLETVDESQNSIDGFCTLRKVYHSSMRLLEVSSTGCLQERASRTDDVLVYTKVSRGGGDDEVRPFAGFVDTSRLLANAIFKTWLSYRLSVLSVDLLGDAILRGVQRMARPREGGLERLAQSTSVVQVWESSCWQP